MRVLAKLGVFSFWIVSTLIFSMMSDIFIGVVLGVWATFAAAFALEKWSERKKA